MDKTIKFKRDFKLADRFYIDLLSVSFWITWAETQTVQAAENCSESRPTLCFQNSYYYILFNRQQQLQVTYYNY